MLSKRSLFHGIGVLIALLLAVVTAQAAESGKFITNKKIVLQVSDDDPAKQALVLNVTDNLINYYGVGNVDIEIVAFGPGVRLLFADNINADHIERLVVNSGIRFTACNNTVAAMTHQLGHAPVLNRRAMSVDAGIVRIMQLIEQGYTLIRP